jgi:hypothetical protein
MSFGQVTNSVAPTSSGNIVLVIIGVVFIVFLILATRTRSVPIRRPRPLRSKWLPVPLSGGSIEFGGRRYPLRAVDYETKQWLQKVASDRFWSRVDTLSPVPLVTLRKEFRHIITARPIGGLVACLFESDRELRKMAIWLLGRSSQGVRIPALQVLRHNPDPELRRHVAKALRRTGDWNELQSLANRDVSMRVRVAAQELIAGDRRDYSESLGRFVEHTRGDIYERGPFHSRMTLWLLSPLGPGKPAKSRAWIRRLLEHIRNLVRASSSDRAA